ncbi:hypothetical protein EWM64_g8746 [Hericium alpestre]|uniref:Uncharacterized protein n=1 Tax=Hericium alpestre TaxID=135208 RepID=A0A4Y9ZMG6_9AGAM|nr:hypothetical protein EWM64_g8746 [Hericium alpestre]
MSSLAFRDSSILILETTTDFIRAGLGLNDLIRAPTVEIPARVGVRTSLLGADSQVTNGNATPASARPLFRLDEGLDVQPSASTSRAASAMPQAHSASAPRITDYLVGKQLDEALEAGQDITVFWPSHMANHNTPENRRAGKRGSNRGGEEGKAAEQPGEPAPKAKGRKRKDPPKSVEYVTTDDDGAGPVPAAPPAGKKRRTLPARHPDQEGSPSAAGGLPGALGGEATGALGGGSGTKNSSSSPAILTHDSLQSQVDDLKEELR